MGLPWAEVKPNRHVLSAMLACRCTLRARCILAARHREMCQPPRRLRPGHSRRRHLLALAALREGFFRFVQQFVACVLVELGRRTHRPTAARQVFTARIDFRVPHSDRIRNSEIRDRAGDVALPGRERRSELILRHRKAVHEVLDSLDEHVLCARERSVGGRSSQW